MLVVRNFVARFYSNKISFLGRYQFADTLLYICPAPCLSEVGCAHIYSGTWNRALWGILGLSFNCQVNHKVTGNIVYFMVLS